MAYELGQSNTLYILLLDKCELMFKCMCICLRYFIYFLDIDFWTQLSYTGSPQLRTAIEDKISIAK